MRDQRYRERESAYQSKPRENEGEDLVNHLNVNPKLAQESV